MLARVHETATPTLRPGPETRDEAADAMLRSSKSTNVQRDTGSNKTKKKKVAMIGAADVCEDSHRVSAEQRKGNSSL